MSVLFGRGCSLQMDVLRLLFLSKKFVACPQHPWNMGCVCSLWTSCGFECLLSPVCVQCPGSHAVLGLALLWLLML